MQIVFLAPVSRTSILLLDESDLEIAAETIEARFVGKGNIQARLRKENNRSKRLGNSWDHFSWFLIKDRDDDLIHDVEVLLLRILPPYLRYMTRQKGNFKGDPTKQEQQYDTPFRIER